MAPRIAFIDLTFNWPPVGGCWVDLYEIMVRLQHRGYEVKLFAPHWTEYYPRGEIKVDLPFPVERIPFNRFTFNAFHVRHRFRRAVHRFKPAWVFLGDGYHMKPHLLAALGDHYPTICRFYAYDVNCLNLHYWLYGQGRICDGGFLTDPNRCHRCWHPGNSFPKRLAKIALGYPDNHPQLHFTQEYASSLAFTQWYRKRLPLWLRKAEKLIVYNEFTADFFRPIHSDVEVISSGVDARRFQPVPDSPQAVRPVLFVPGRVNDELKGFETVRRACHLLRGEGLDFELRITAAYEMRFEEDWIVNLGWVPQSKVHELYRGVDVAIIPSIWVEPFGITTLEAMASGIPVVGSKIGGISQTLVDGETGFHFEPGNEVSLANCLRKLLKSRELRLELGQGGRDRVIRYYDWDRITDSYYVPLFSRGRNSGDQEG